MPGTELTVTNFSILGKCKKLIIVKGFKKCGISNVLDGTFTAIVLLVFLHCFITVILL